MTTDSSAARLVQRRPDLTLGYLASCVQRRTGCDPTTARQAVAEVIDALRANPAWLEGLGIGRE